MLKDISRFFYISLFFMVLLIISIGNKDKVHTDLGAGTVVHRAPNLCCSKLD